MKVSKYKFESDEEKEIFLSVKDFSDLRELVINSKYVILTSFDDDSYNLEFVMNKTQVKYEKEN